MSNRFSFDPGPLDESDPEAVGDVVEVLKHVRDIAKCTDNLVELSVAGTVRRITKHSSDKELTEFVESLPTIQRRHFQLLTEITGEGHTVYESTLVNGQHSWGVQEGRSGAGREARAATLEEAWAAFKKPTPE